MVAYGMSLAAGMSTGIGALLVCFTTSLNRTLLACTMSFSAGVMIYVSLVEVVAVANEHFDKSMPSSTAYMYANLSFFAGVLLMALVNRLVHTIFVASARSGERAAVYFGTGSRPASPEHDAAAIHAVAQIEDKQRLLAMAAVVSAAIVLHNIPEGMATYVASFHSVSAGLPLCFAIAIHNIPEGLAVAMPIYYATESRTRAVVLGTLSGLSEPFGAVLASLVANENSSSAVFGFMFGLTAGMMVFVCISELLPAAYAERGVRRDAVVLAFFLGCAVMSSSLVIERFASAGFT